MNTWSSRSEVTFSNPFSLSGYPEALPPGNYEVVVEEERLLGPSFEVWRRTATYLMVHGGGGCAGRTEMRATTENDLKEALSRDRVATEKRNHSEAALSPQEDLI